VYTSTSSLQITNTLTLDAQSKADAVWIFQIGSSLTVIEAAQVVIVNPGENTKANVFWNVGSSATIGASATLVGIVMAMQAVSVGAGGSKTDPRLWPMLPPV
jgi:hypothetical protein